MQMLIDFDITEIPKKTARSRYPLLWKYGNAPPGTANAAYREPFELGKRTQDHVIFFEREDYAVVALPKAVMAMAARRLLFSRLWNVLGHVAERLVGDIYEKTIAIACQGKADHVCEKTVYAVGSDKYEMDVAVRHKNEVTLFEVTSKTLTERARSGDLAKTVDDYTKSYLKLLRQLVRHERHIKSGKTPLTIPGENLREVQITKVAVSPLSYGPISDKHLATTLMHAAITRRLSLHSQDSTGTTSYDKFNETIDYLAAQMEEMDKAQGKEWDPFPYLYRVVWLDLGQLLYLLDRATVIDGRFFPLMSITSGTRDLWTELANWERRRRGP